MQHSARILSSEASNWNSSCALALRKIYSVWLLLGHAWYQEKMMARLELCV